MIDRDNHRARVMATALGCRDRGAALAAAPRIAAPARTGTSSTATAPAATPRVQRMAAERGVVLAEVRGTGTGGRITPTDVRAASLVEAGQRRRAAAQTGPTIKAGGLARGAALYQQRRGAGAAHKQDDTERARPARVAASLTTGAQLYEQRRGHAVPDRPGTA